MVGIVLNPFDDSRSKPYKMQQIQIQEKYLKHKPLNIIKQLPMRTMLNAHSGYKVARLRQKRLVGIQKWRTQTIQRNVGFEMQNMRLREMGVVLILLHGLCYLIILPWNLWNYLRFTNPGISCQWSTLQVPERI